MRLQEFIKEPNLNTISAAITGYWLVTFLLILLSLRLQYSTTTSAAVDAVAKVGFKPQIENLIFVLPVIILLSACYTTYFTLINRQFNTVYNKGVISVFRRTFFKISLTVFVVVWGTLTVLDLKHLEII